MYLVYLRLTDYNACTESHLSVLFEVRPHAGPIAPSHENMVGEEVDARKRAGKLASTGFIIVAHISDHVVEL